ncbi:secreted protein, partial [mine drainage metagenome]
MRTDAARPLSLLARSALASLLALVAFLGVTGFALDRAYYEGTLTAERDRLQSYFYAYLAGFDVRRDGTLISPDAPPQPDFDRPGPACTRSSPIAEAYAGHRVRRAGAICRSRVISR